MAHVSGISGDGDAYTKNADTTTPNKGRKLRLPFENILSLGNDPKLFGTLKHVTRSTTCHNCGLAGSRRCSHCRQTYYCSVTCQKQDWKDHSVICRPPAPKETNGNNPVNGADAVSRGNAKTEASRIPDTRHDEVKARRILLGDLQKEALSEGAEFQGYVVEFSSPSNFFVKAFDSKLVDNLMKMSSSLQNLYSDPSTIKKGYTPDIGEVCVAKYHQDQQWYRALMYNVEPTMRTAQVLYLDYGNAETISLDSVQPMHPDVPLLPPFALHCSLADVTAPPFGWTPECLVDVKRLLVGQKLLIRITDVVHGPLPRYTVHVSLCDSGEDVNKVIIEKGYSFPPLNTDQGNVEDPEKGGTSAPDNPRTEADRVSRLGQTEMPELMAEDGGQDGAALRVEVVSSSLQAGDSFETLITVIHNPEMFFCQQVQNAEQLTEVMTLMRDRYSTSPADPLFSPAPRDICAAQFSEDSNWYRASVVQFVSCDSVLVGYLDFGNTETLPTSCIRRIEPDLLSVPFQAVQCCLAGVKPLSGKWSAEETDAFKVLVMNKILTASILANRELVLTLELTDKSVTPHLSISHHLIKAGLAVPSTAADEEEAEAAAEVAEDRTVPLRWTTLPLGKETEVSVCMLQNPGDFFCHLHNHTDLQLLNKLNESLRQYCAQNMAGDHDPARDEVCGAYYAGDGNWYRAQVKGGGHAGATKILFVDYGNTEHVSADKLCRIPASFLELPFQAISCSLSGVKPDGENWSADCMKTFQKSVVGVKLRARAVERTKRGFSVELVAIDGGTAISDLLVAAKCAVRDETSSARKTEVTGNKTPRPLRDPSPAVTPTAASIHVRGGPAHKESGSGDRSHSPSRLPSPADPIPAVGREGPAATLRAPKQLPSPNVPPRDLIADPPGGRGLHSSKVAPFPLKDVRFPKSNVATARDPALSTHRASNNSWSPRAPNGFNSTKPIPKAPARNAPSAVPRGGHSSTFVPMEFRASSAPVCKERHPGTVSPSQKGAPQTKSIPAPSGESGVTNAPSGAPGTPHAETSPTLIPGESLPSVSPPSLQHPFIPDASTLDPSNPSSHQSAPSTSGELLSRNSSPAAPGEPASKRGETPIYSPPSNASSHGEVQNLSDKSENGNSAAGRDLPGVPVARGWLPVDLPVDRALPACVLAVISPDLFYVFPKENRVDVKRLHQVMMEIQEYCSMETAPHHYRPSAGDVCCAKFTEDGQWYRAVVLEVQDSSAKIAYADYGNVEVRPFSCLLPMKKRFLELPMQLTKCSLADVLPVSESWSPEAARTFTSLLLGAEVLVTAASLTAGIYRVSVDKPQESGVLHVAERLVADGLAWDVTARSARCPEKSAGCCCRDLLIRMEKLEEIVLQLLPTEKIQ